MNPAHNASVKCDRMRSQKLRRRPDSCHAFHPEVGVAGGRGAGLGLHPQNLGSVTEPVYLQVCASGHRMQLHINIFIRVHSNTK